MPFADSSTFIYSYIVLSYGWNMTLVLIQQGYRVILSEAVHILFLVLEPVP